MVVIEVSTVVILVAACCGARETFSDCLGDGALAP
eukprot:COSAG02_NODE_43706_length_372_cov_0.945055_1_plen_34_part_01